jgi:hypothetical protein
MIGPSRELPNGRHPFQRHLLAATQPFPSFPKSQQSSPLEISHSESPSHALMHFSAQKPDAGSSPSLRVDPPEQA